MAFKMDKRDKKRRDEIVIKLREARAKLEDEVAAFNEDIENSKEKSQTALADYNELLEEARGLIQDISSQAEADMGNKSEKWQDGTKGKAVLDWLEALQDPDLGDIDIDFPEPINLDIEDHAEMMENLPEEPDA